VMKGAQAADVTHALTLALLLDRMSAVPELHASKNPLNILEAWCGEFAMELSINGWHRATPTGMVLNGVRPVHNHCAITALQNPVGLHVICELLCQGNTLVPSGHCVQH